MLIALFLAVSALLSPVSAATWYFLRYNLPSSQAFLSFSGTMQIPKLPQAGTYYLWPGLQPTDNSGVLPWGSGFNTYQGESVAFSNVKDSSGSTWTSKLTRGSSSVSNSFALGSKTFNQVLFAIELTGVSWDFGPLVFDNVVITSSGTSTSWCTNAPENYNGASNYAVSGVSATVSGNVVTCKINSVTLQSPK
ncbi:hypothetical protein SLS60_006911 [Paraconiothyrium brasiliense]|uniref:Uncharacterized protein n=1 Tax=Paraconiothyrium brasiliense TaxID=300254 RepID=A0ABR3R7X0_9PLEO